MSNKKDWFSYLVLSVLFLVYTLAVVIETLRIGFRVLHVEPLWLDVAYSFFLAFAIIGGAIAYIYLSTSRNRPEFSRREHDSVSSGNKIGETGFLTTDEELALFRHYSGYEKRPDEED